LRSVVALTIANQLAVKMINSEQPLLQNVRLTNKTDLTLLLNDLDAQLKISVRIKEIPVKLHGIGSGANGTIYCYQLSDNRRFAGKKAKFNSLYDRSKEETQELSSVSSKKF
jgi:hypothetical protein